MVWTENDHITEFVLQKVRLDQVFANFKESEMPFAIFNQYVKLGPSATSQ